MADVDLAELYRALLLPRVIEDKMLRLLRQGRLGKWFSGIGQEAVAVGVTWALRPDDWVLPMHRNLGVFTTRASIGPPERRLDLDRLLRQLFTRADGFTAGRDRTFHFGSIPDHVVGMISHLGAMVPVACGLGLASTLRGDDPPKVAAAFFGDGGSSEGDLHEAMNLAAVWRLPVVFVCENNQYGLSTPTSEQYACERLADRAVGYGMPGEVVDGNDVLSVIEAVGEAAERARRGEGPTLLEFLTFRMRGHEEASGTEYVPATLVDEWATRDPLERLERVLEQRAVMSVTDREALRATVVAEVDRRVAAALDAPEPTSTVDDELAAVYAAPVRARARPQPGPGRELRYLDAIREAMGEALAADPTVVLLGQDIAEYGGAFKATEGLAERFGKHRVRNTPIIESGALGCALGLALDGFHPLVEMQFADFVTCGFNQIVNNLAKTHYRWGAGVPVVVRLPAGGGLGAGPFHSQDPEAWFAHVAGLRVVAPATPADAKGLLLAAFDETNPVIFVEHKGLYRSLRGPVSDGWYTVPIGSGRVAKPGRDATVVAYGVAVSWALEAADALAADGYDVEVIDLRSLVPWDRSLVLASVARTGKALVVHEAPRTAGFGAELAAVIGEEAFADLDAPVARVGAADTPVPHHRGLEQLVSAQTQLLPALRRLLAF